MHHSYDLAPFPLKTSLAMAAVVLSLGREASRGFQIQKGKTENLIVRGQISLLSSTTLQS